MKSKNFLLVLIFYIIAFSGCSQNKVNLPCNTNGVPFEIKLKNRVNLFPDSLGGNLTTGFIGVKVLWGDDSSMSNIMIVSIKLIRNDTIYYNYFNSHSSIDSTNKSLYPKVARDYFDFIEQFLKKKVDFIPNTHFKNCKESRTIAYYYLKFGIIN